MAKRTREPKVDVNLDQIVSEHVERLVTSVSAVLREHVALEVLSYFADGPALDLGRRRRSKREMGCIAPNCKNVSKGPRFHYLCDKHKEASKTEYKAWQAAKKQERDAEAA